MAIGVLAVLYVHGKSVRISHYFGYRRKTGMIELHKVDASNLEMVNNGKQFSANDKLDSAIFSQNWSLGRDLDPRPSPYQGDAPPG